jgi:hypothetical protein
MGKPRKKIIETHGKVEEVQAPTAKFQPTTLDQVWGFDGLSRYGTDNEDVYRKRVESMTRADLETHARQMGVVISENSLILRDKLMTDFRQNVALARRPIDGPRRPESVTEAAKKVLAEGR